MDKHTYDTINLLAELGFRIGCYEILEEKDENGRLIFRPRKRVENT